MLASPLASSSPSDAEALAADDFLASFLPLAAPPPLTPAWLRRCLLTGPAGCGLSSLLFQFALNRARRGSSVLYVHCGPRTELPSERPVRPRLGATDGICTLDGEDADGTSRHEEERQLLRMIHIKYATTWSELQEMLRDLHLHASRPADVDRLPATLILCGLPSLFKVAAADATATPSPSKPAPQSAAMHMALGLALAAHAADLLDAPPSPQLAAALPGDAAAAVAAPPAPAVAAAAAAGGHEPAMLLVACTSPRSPEPELASRWLSAIVRVDELSATARTDGSRVRTPATLATFERRRHWAMAVSRGALDDACASLEYGLLPGHTLEPLAPDEPPSLGRSPLAPRAFASQPRSPFARLGNAPSSSHWTPASAMGAGRRRLAGPGKTTPAAATVTGGGASLSSESWAEI